MLTSALMLLLGLQAAANLSQPLHFAEFPPTKGHHAGMVLRVIDGDTVEIAILVKRTARIHGIDAPEKNTEAGQRSAEALKSMLRGTNVTNMRFRGTDKYGRLLVDVQNADGWWVSYLMTLTGHAKPWDGHGPKPRAVEKPALLTCTGLLRDGVVAKGAETTGIILITDNMTFELDVHDDLSKEVERFSGKLVYVAGTLTSKKGLAVPERWIVKVSELKAVEP